MIAHARVIVWAKICETETDNNIENIFTYREAKTTKQACVTEQDIRNGYSSVKKLYQFIIWGDRTFLQRAIKNLVSVKCNE